MTELAWSLVGALFVWALIATHFALKNRRMFEKAVDQKNDASERFDNAMRSRDELEIQVAKLKPAHDAVHALGNAIVLDGLDRPGMNLVNPPSLVRARADIEICALGLVGIRATYEIDESAETRKARLK